MHSALTPTQLDVSVQQELRPYDIVSFKEDQCAASIRRQADHFNTVRTHEVNARAHTHPPHSRTLALYLTEGREQISLWVASEIVQVGNMSKRVHVLQTMIALASVRTSHLLCAGTNRFVQKLKKLQNYNSLMALIAGLNTVRRIASHLTLV